MKNRKSVVVDSRGQSLVEFALILPIMLGVTLMITEFGRALYQYNSMTMAVREGAREGVVHDAATAVSVATARTNAALSLARINPSDVTLTVDILSNYGGVQGVKVLRVRAVKPFVWAFQGPLKMTGGGTVAKSNLNLTAESIMHAEAFQ